MNQNHIRHLPVIDNYSLIGVVSIRDISTAFDEAGTPGDSRLKSSFPLQPQGPALRQR